jgi:ABC-type polysaccharide/polyol phosphate export permease
VGKIHYLDLLVYRVLNGFFQGFIVSLIYSLIVLWFFGIHSGSLFMRYWMFNWLSVMVFGLIVVLFTTNFGSIANSVLTVFIMLMLASGTIQISLELSPRFYRYGYGLPLYHIVNGGRHLLFDSHERFALTVGVLLIYFGVFWIVVIVTSALWMKKQEHKVLKEKQKTKTDKRRYFTAPITRH